jgi:tight adherence protein B
VTRTTFLIGQGAVVFATLTWFLIVVFYFAKDTQPGRLALRRYGDNLAAKFRFLRIRYPSRRLILFQLGTVGLVILMSALRNSLLPLLLLPLITMGPTVYLDRLAAIRVTNVEAQIEPWLVAIANALKASPSLGEAIASTATLVSAPMSEEVDLMVKEYELGTALDVALDQMAKRIGSKTLTGAVLALQVARNSGGNLPEMLENAAIALRELARLEGVVRTKTAEGKAQAFVIGMIPVPMVLLIHSIDKYFFDPLVNAFTGHLIIGGAVTLWALAILLSSKILAVDV